MIESVHTASAEQQHLNIGAVVIGRNEGARLEACLASLAGKVAAIVYVDSGSTDNSLEIAARYDAHAISLDMAQSFTAARARNVGWRAFDDIFITIEAVQFVDGDCELVDGWLDAAAQFLARHPQVAAVCGRRLERYPQASVYNHMCDIEWNTPIGAAKSIGGDALVRLSALDSVSGYNDAVIAGEEPEMCVRLRQAGWTIYRIGQNMTLHDAAIHSFPQWWRRSVRGGYAYALGAYMHGWSPEKHFLRQTLRALFWGIALPLIALSASVTLPFGWLVWLAYPLQWLRMYLQVGQEGYTVQSTFLLLLEKTPQCIGIMKLCFEKVLQKDAKIIEYK